MIMIIITILQVFKIYFQKGDPIEVRYKESLERGPMMNQLGYRISSYRDAALLKDPKFDHIDLADKQKVCTHELQKLTRVGQLILLLCR